jgi:hypothetical protein
MINKEVIQHLQSYRQDMPCAYSFWTPDDVKTAAHQKCVSLEEDEIKQVLSNVHENQDCNTGINWFVIESAIDDVLAARKEA